MDGTLDEWAQPVVDPETRAYIYSLVTALGGSSAEEDGQYVLGDDALACLKDLRRWVKFYDERLNRLDVARCLAEANLVKGDLLEILASWPEDKTEDRLRSKIALTCLELLVPLTWPQEIEDDQFTVNHHRHLNYIQLAQVDYKRTILTYDRAKILRTIVRVGLPSMALPKSERTARDEGIIRLMIYFFRNIAMISQPQHLPNSGDDAEISRSALVDAFHEQDILQVLLTLASSTGVEYALQDVVVLETLFHLLKGVDPRKLMMEDGNLAKSNTNELRGLIQKEKAMLADQARNGPTRHNRWSSMIWVKRDGEKISTVSGQDAIANAQRSLQKMDKSKKWNKPRQARRNKEEAGQNVFDVPISLTASARKRLRNFVEEFLDSSFNPLFSHLRKALESESSRVLRIHSMQYFYLVSWFLQAETARRSRIREQRKKKGSLTQEEDESFALVASVLNQETFVLLSRFMQQSQDAKEWQHLNAGMKCFTQILLTVQDMSESALEDDQEIAENIQNRVFYEQYTHDQVISIVRDYKGQGFGYLNACTELAHVFLRMLERHSKQNVDMQVRSRRRARKKRKQAEKPAEDEDGVGDGNESENDDIREAHQTSSERKFEFSRFAAKFMNQGCIETFVTFIKFYRDLSVEQLKRAHRFFYRCAFKMELAVLLFRVDILHLFYKMVKGPDGLDRDSPCFKDWEEFSRQLFRRVVKKVDSRPELFVEMLFSKIPATLYYLEHGYEKEVPTKAPRPPAELEVKPGMDLKDRIGVAVSVLVNQQKSDALNWAKGMLFKAEEQRRTWEQQQASQATNPEANGETNGESISQPQSDISTDGEPQPQSPSSQERSPAPSITVHPDNEERRVSLFKDNKLRLLLTLLGFTLLSDPSDPVAVWTIPSTLSASDLAEKLSWIRAFEFDPPTYEEGKSAEDYLRSVKAAARSRGQSDDEGEAQWGDDSEGEEDFEFPANLRTKNPNSNDKSKPKRHLKRRPRKELDDDERAAREQARKQKDLEKRRKIKSELYVHDSDEENDEEADREFFAREEALRNKTGADHIKALTQKGIEEKGSKKRKAGENGKSSSKKRKSDEESAGETDDETQENGAVLLSSRETSPEEDVLTALGPESGEESDADTPLSSQHKSSRRGSAGDIDIATKEPTTTQDTDMVDLDQESEEDAPIMKPRPTQRRMRAGFVIDSDSE